MKWSFSTSKLFSSCQRKWYFSQIVASHGKKDLYRREAYLLKQLKSIQAWRGSVVDKIIESFMVPEIRKKRLPSELSTLSFAAQLIKKQLDFGKAQKHRELNISKTAESESYAAFYDLEYNGHLDDNLIAEAIGEINTSISNLLNSSFLFEIAKNNYYVIAQRRLTHSLDDTTISCTPDLLVFYSKTAPMIVDWKVHAFATEEYWLQLGIYAYILSLVRPHKDFPSFDNGHIQHPENFKLVEYQLLTNRIREYTLSKEDIIEIEDYIFDSIGKMKRLVNGKKYPEIDADLFQTATSPQKCLRCEYRKLCWGDNNE